MRVTAVDDTPCFRQARGSALLNRRQHVLISAFPCWVSSTLLAAHPASRSTAKTWQTSIKPFGRCYPSRPGVSSDSTTIRMQISKTVRLLMFIRTLLPFHGSLTRKVNPTPIKRVKLATGEMFCCRDYVLPSDDVAGTGVIALACVVEAANAHKIQTLTDCQLSSTN
jgi:hypothetical protein